MTNSNLKTFDNFYADLAQAAYTGRPVKFPYESQKKYDREELDSGQSLEFDFSKDAEFYNKNTKKLEITPEANIFLIMVRFTCSQILIYILWKIR